MDIRKIEARRNKILNSEEFNNFTTLIQSVRELFNPDSATLRVQTEKGTKLSKRRVSIAGTSMMNDYASGVISEAVTSGEQWFEYVDRKKQQDAIEMLDKMTKITYDSVNSSNLHSELHRDISSACCDGTSCMYVERLDGKLNFVHVPFGSFQFVQDYAGRPNIVWIEKTTTVGALVAQYGTNVSDKTMRDNETDPEKEVKIIYYCCPRNKRDASKADTKNKPYMLLTYEKDDCHLLEEGGVDMQKFLVYRIKRIGNEILGRGPCIDTVCTMAALERCSKDMQRGMRLNVVPIFACAASLGQNGFRVIHQEDASMMVYNDTGMSGPPQAINPQVNVEFGQKYMEWMISQMRALFFLDYFNPLDNRRNMTLGEAKERVSKAQQMVDQIVGPLKEERLNPLLRWCFILLGESGAFSEFGSWIELQKKLFGRVEIRYKSRLANIQKKIRLLSTVESVNTTMLVAQGIPDPVMQYEFLSRWRWDLLPEEIQEGTNAPERLLRPIEEAKKMAQQFAESLAKQQETENMVKTADAASKGGTAPQPGSLTDLVLGGQGGR